MPSTETPTAWTAAASLGYHLREVNLFLTVCNYFFPFSPGRGQCLPNWILTVYGLVAFYVFAFSYGFNYSVWVRTQQETDGLINLG